MSLSLNDQGPYRAIVEDLRSAVDSLPPGLRACCAPSLARLAEGAFAPLAALLPAWLNDLLPVEPAAVRALGRAGLAAWWYGQALDDSLDGDGVPATPLIAQTAMLLALEGYRGLGLAATPAWADLHRRMALSADAHARELATRFGSLPELRPAQLAAWEIDLVIGRAEPFLFAVTAQATLAGLPPDGPPASDLERALARLVAARQIGDDASDWIDDLRYGRLNLVAARLTAGFMAERAGVSLDFERLAGYQAGAEAAWAAFEAEHDAHCAAALAGLAPYPGAALAALVEAQQERGAQLFAGLRRSRLALRQLMGLR